MYYIKLQGVRGNGVKTCGIKGKEALTGDWEELNKETYVIYVYKTTQKLTSACKYKLIKLLTFILVPYETDVGNCRVPT